MDFNEKYDPSVVKFMGDLLNLGNICTLDEIRYNKDPKPILVGRIIAVFPLVGVSSKFQQENVLIYHLKEVYSSGREYRNSFKVIFVGQAALVMNNYQFTLKDYLLFPQVSLTRDTSFKRYRDEELHRCCVIVGLWSLNDIRNIYFRKRDGNSWSRIDPNYGMDNLPESQSRNSQNSDDENTQSPKTIEKRKVVENVCESLPKRRKLYDVSNLDETTESRISCETTEHQPSQESLELIPPIDLPNPNNSETSEPSVSDEQIPRTDNKSPASSPRENENSRTEIELLQPSSSKEIQFCADIETSTVSSPVEEEVRANLNVPVSSTPRNIHECTEEPLPSCSKQFCIDSEKSKSPCGDRIPTNNNDETVFVTWPSNDSDESFTIEAFLDTILSPFKENSINDILWFIKGYCDCCTSFFPSNGFPWITNESEIFPICQKCREEGIIRNLRPILMFQMKLRDEEKSTKIVSFMEKYAENFLGFTVFELCNSDEARAKAVELINAYKYEEGKENKLLSVKITPIKDCHNEYTYLGTHVKIL